MLRGSETIILSVEEAKSLMNIIDIEKIHKNKAAYNLKRILNDIEREDEG